MDNGGSQHHCCVKREDTKIDKRWRDTEREENEWITEVGKEMKNLGDMRTANVSDIVFIQEGNPKPSITAMIDSSVGLTKQ